MTPGSPQPTPISGFATADQLAPWMVLLATIALAFKGIVAKFAYAEGLTLSWILILRFGFALPFFWLGARMMRAGNTEALLGRRELGACALTSGLFFLATLCDFGALTLIDAGLSRVILFTFPAFILLFAAIRRRAWPPLRDMAAFALTYCGLLLVVQPGTGLSTESWVGILLALGSALSYALFLTTSQSLTKALGSARFTALSGSFTLLFVLPMPLVLGGLSPLPSVEGLILAAIIALFCTVLPFFMLFEGIRRWGAEKAGLMTLSGPAITVAAAWAFLGEVLTPLQWGGFVVVVAGVAILQKTDRGLKTVFLSVMRRQRG
ncbi:MAG: EamA family transporter [Rhodospirillaceae bacterium]